MCTGGAFRTKVGVPRGGAVNVISPSLIISIITNQLLLPNLHDAERKKSEPVYPKFIKNMKLNFLFLSLLQAQKIPIPKTGWTPAKMERLHLARDNLGGTRRGKTFINFRYQKKSSHYFDRT